MSSYVLVHGAWHGGWVWHEVVPRLRAAGHAVLAPDLPAHGTDTTPPAGVELDDYVERVVDAVESAGEPTVLVGHSAGGITIAQVAERVPDRLRALVFVAAFLPRDGQSLADLSGGPAEDGALEREVDEDEGVTRVAGGTAREAFYADCTEAQVALADALLRPEPLAPLDTPVDLGEASFGSVPRAYVRCGADRAIAPANQDRMRRASPCDATYELSAGHSPFLAAPDALTDHLLAVPEDLG